MKNGTILNSNIILFDENVKPNTKASEEYVHVRFNYPESHFFWDGWVPIEYRRTGTSIKKTDKQKLYAHLNYVYDSLQPQRYPQWLQEQEEFWKTKPNSTETKPIFDILKDGKWHCRNCEISNPNFARRIQDLKELGFTIATEINYKYPDCGNKRSTRLLLLPIKRVELAGNGYETWSKELRKRILKVLGNKDVYENTIHTSCLPDHKFSEIRWDNDTKAENPDTMTDEEIKNKFQLLSNQRNQQKREVCRKCLQTGKRGSIYGINYYYKGNENWDNNIPIKGKKAEDGCIGCPWYDIQKWREELNKTLAKSKE